MQYMIIGAVGAGIGIIDLLLLLLVQKREELIVFDKKPFCRPQIVWGVVAGMILAGIYFTWLVGEWPYTMWSHLLLVGYLFPLSIVDYKYKQLPDTFHVVYGIVFVLFKVLFGTWRELLNGGTGVLVILVLFGAVCLVKKDQFGLGDLKALCVCAFLVGIPSIFYIFFRGLIVAAIYSIVQLLRRTAELKTEFPLIPFLLIGTIL